MKLSDEEYFNNAALNFTTIKELLKSPKHFWDAMQNPKEKTKAMELGSTIHCAILEPDKFAADYVAEPGLDKRTKAYKEWAEANEGKVFYNHNELLDIMDAVCQAEQYCEALQLIKENKTINEEAFFYGWKDLDLKCKVDAYCPEKKMLIDIKTTTEVQPDKFNKIIFERAYHLQMAHYVQCLEANDKPVDEVRIVAIGTASPSDVVEFVIPNEVLERAERELLELYSRASYVRQFDVHCGYATKPVVAAYPGYYKDFLID